MAAARSQVILPPECEEQHGGKSDGKLKLRPAPHEVRDAGYRDVT